MDPEIKKTIEALGRAFEEFKAENNNRLLTIEKGKTPDPLLVEKVDKINADIGQISAFKKQLEMLDAAVARANFPGGGFSEQDKIKAEHKAVFEKWFRRGQDEERLKALQIQAALTTQSDPDSGYLVPEVVEQAIDRVAMTVSAMRRLCMVITISTDAYKKLVSQGGTGSGWVGEIESRAETDTPTLKEIVINTKEIYAMPKASQTTLDDSRIDLAQWLADEVAIEFNEEEADAFISGDGVSEPKGLEAYTMIANASYVWGDIGYIAGGAASTFTNADKLQDLRSALKSVYRNGAVWLMNDATELAIRKFKDGNGNYLWQPGLTLDAPSTLIGKPIEIDDNVADIGTNAYPIWFGNFKRAYLIVDRMGIRVLRDPYSSKPYILFYTTKRVGGGIVLYESIKALKIAVS